VAASRAALYLLLVARPPRLQVPGGIFHVCSRGVRRLPIFEDDQDRLLFLQLLALVCARHGWRIHAYCLMTNHYHLLIEIRDANLSVGMQELNSRYAQLFDERHGHAGHVFERRFYSELIESDWHFLAAARYIVLNPVRAGLCATPGEWPWSSYSATVAPISAPVFVERGRLLGYFGPNEASARKTYEEFVEDARERARSP
jgi:REP element-mobilizing transposase RayT